MYLHPLWQYGYIFIPMYGEVYCAWDKVPLSGYAEVIADLGSLIILSLVVVGLAKVFKL
jgi:hypothetical protein